MGEPTCLLLVLPLPIYSVNDILYLDSQACNGLRLWLENFDRVILCNPLIEKDAQPAGTLPLRQAVPSSLLEIHPLPAAWTPVRFAGTLPAVRRQLGNFIDRSSHLQFALGGLWGDWGAVGALIAAGRGRKAAVWTDRVESEVMRLHALRMTGARRLYRLGTAWLARHYERYVIRRATLGLFHGMDTYNAYARYSARPALVHDIHLGPAARITPDNLARKLATQASGRLRIVYAGRVHPDKGVIDWIEALAILAGNGVLFDATWYGDGPELTSARQWLIDRGLTDRVRFHGAIHDRETLMAHVREADIFLFCHRTPESPRCLIEALILGTPIVGYDSAYPADLISAHDGGVLAPMKPAALAELVAAIELDRPRLQTLTQAAAMDGANLVDEEVFRHRSQLIKSL